MRNHHPKDIISVWPLSFLIYWKLRRNTAITQRQTIVGDTGVVTLLRMHFNRKLDKKGAMVYPDYQRKGRGSWLTRHCNEVADRTGDKIFVVARPSSKHMFESHGFHVLGSEDIDMTKYGGNETEGKSWVLVREPHEVSDVEN
jgi:N-acetylglutamate synthase-like GNAT family acetyltransferase